jgi:hypothetical protein
MTVHEPPEGQLTLPSDKGRRLSVGSGWVSVRVG